MTRKFPDFAAVAKQEERYLTERLRGIRSLISHPGEKGRALEGIVSDLLRTMLPAEYGLSTGFVVFEDDDGSAQLSPQLDIIIYDALSSGPLARLGTVDVFPLEAVYAYVEVKAALKASSAKKLPEDSIEYCLQTNEKIRKMTRRWYWAPGPTQVSRKRVAGHSVPIRHYIFAFDAVGRAGDADFLKARVEAASKRLGSRKTPSGRLITATHLHGVLIANKVLLHTKAVDPAAAKARDLHRVEYFKDHALARFKLSLLVGLARLGRTPPSWAPDLARYYAPGMSIEK